MTPLQSAEHALSEIARTDSLVRAWVAVDSERVRLDAAAVDEQLRDRVPLALPGITVGVKDIFDVAGMPTVAGFRPFADRVAAADADVVAMLRRAGALIVGKTTTTQFASSDPTETRNPWGLDRTPGGSSSGSAVAVAAGHVDVALGSQTGGSTLRPASFCGVVGFKPAFGWVSRGGMLPLAPSLDTVGLIGRSVEVVARVYNALSATEDAAADSAAPTRLGVWSNAIGLSRPPIRAAVESAIRSATEHGIVVADADADISYAQLRAVHQIIMLCEAAAVHSRLIRTHAEHYAPNIRSFVEVGASIPATMYVRALALRDQYREQLTTRWHDYDAVVLPTANTTAPTRETTGDPALQAVATMLGLPSLSLPIGLAGDGLPIGLQLIAPRHDGARRLLGVAAWLAAQLPSLPPTPLATR